MPIQQETNLDVFESGGTPGDSNDLSSDTFPAVGGEAPDTIGLPGEEEEVIEEIKDSDFEEEIDKTLDKESEKKLEESKKETDPKTVAISLPDGKTANIPQDTKVPTLVDGNEETPTLQELRSNWSGVTNLNRQYSQMGEERKQIRAEREDIYRERAVTKEQIAGFEQKFAKVGAAAKEGRLEDLLNGVIEMNQVDSVKFWDDFDSQMSSYYAGYNQLSDSEKKQVAATRANQLLTKQMGQKQQTQEQERQAAAERQVLDGICEQYQLQDQQVQVAWAELNKLNETGQMPAETGAKIKAMNPREKYEYAAAWAKGGEIETRISDAVERVAPTLDATVKRTVANKVANVFGLRYGMQANDRDFDDAVKTATAKLNGNADTKKKEEERATETPLGDKASSRHQKPLSPEEEDLYSRDGSMDSSAGVWGADFDVN